MTTYDLPRPRLWLALSAASMTLAAFIAAHRRRRRRPVVGGMSDDWLRAHAYLSGQRSTE